MFDQAMPSLLDDNCILFSISPNIAANAMKQEIDTLFDRITINKEERSNFQIPSGEIIYNVNVEIDTLSTSNIIAVLPASIETQKSIVISAHYDHLGKTNEGIFYGADDNASGVAAMLEIARMLNADKKSGLFLPFNIVFLATGAEERGLWGSGYYAKHPLLPLDSTIANINLDMLGRVDPDYNEKDDEQED